MKQWKLIGLGICGTLNVIGAGVAIAACSAGLRVWACAGMMVMGAALYLLVSLGDN